MQLNTNAAIAIRSQTSNRETLLDHPGGPKLTPGDLKSNQRDVAEEKGGGMHRDGGEAGEAFEGL